MADTPLVVERMRFELDIPPWYPIFLGTEREGTDYLKPISRYSKVGWMMLTEYWKCNPSKRAFHRTPDGFGMMGHQIITPWGLTCIALYDGRPVAEFPQYIRKEFGL